MRWAKAEKAALRLAELADPPDAAALAAAIQAVQRKGPLDAQLAEAEEDAVKSAAKAAEALAALPLWPGDGDGLARAVLPGAETVSRFEDDFAALDQRSVRLQTAAEALETDRLDTERQRAELARGRAMPTLDLLHEARERRDRRWAAIRAKFIDGTSAAADDDLVAPQDFQAAMGDADAIADRRAAEARLQTAQAALEAARAQQQHGHRDLQRCALFLQHDGHLLRCEGCGSEVADRLHPAPAPACIVLTGGARSRPDQ